MKCDSCDRRLSSSDIYEDNPGFAFFYFCGHCDEKLSDQDLAESVHGG